MRKRRESLEEAGRLAGGEAELQSDCGRVEEEEDRETKALLERLRVLEVTSPPPSSSSSSSSSRSPALVTATWRTAYGVRRLIGSF